MACELKAYAVRDDASLNKYRLSARQWLEDNFPPEWRPDSINFVAPAHDDQVAWERALYEAGYAGFTWPKEYGGQGQTLIEQLIVNDELGQVGIFDSLNAIGKDTVGPVILAIGSEEQKHRYLPPILTMEEIWCQGFSEAEAGSDLANVRTAATETDRGWVINGQKLWVSFAQIADLCLVLARTAERTRENPGLSLFIVPIGAPGVVVRPIDQINGRANFCEVTFHEVEIDANAVLGDINEGWAGAGRVLQIERAINRMYRASLFENELRHLIRACASDKALRAMLDTSDFRDRIGSCYADIQLLRRLVRRTVLSLARGDDLGHAGSLIKIHWSETHQRLTTLARDVLPHATRPLSVLAENAIVRFEELYLRSRAETIQGGANPVQLRIIANRVLELPRQ